jgi:hypothetical protein
VTLIADGDFSWLLQVLRGASLVGWVLLVLEWCTGIALVWPTGRWGVPVVWRSVAGAPGSSTRGRTKTKTLVAARGDTGCWMLRARFGFLGPHTPFPIFGLASRDGDSLKVVGRQPVGGFIFFGALLLQEVLTGLAPLFQRSAHDTGMAVTFPWALVVFTAALYAASSLLEHWRFQRAVRDFQALMAEA